MVGDGARSPSDAQRLDGAARGGAVWSEHADALSSTDSVFYDARALLVALGRTGLSGGLLAMLNDLMARQGAVRFGRNVSTL